MSEFQKLFKVKEYDNWIEIYFCGNKIYENHSILRKKMFDLIFICSEFIRQYDIEREYIETDLDELI